MVTRFAKRAFPMFLSLVMLISMVPVQAFAIEADDQEQDVAEELIDSGIASAENPSDDLTAPPEDEEKSLDQQIQEQLDAVLTATGANAWMSDEEIVNAVISMEEEGYMAVFAAIEALEDLVPLLTQEEIDSYNETEKVETFGRVYSAIMELYTPALLATSGNYTPVTGVTVQVSGATNTSSSNGAVTVTAKGSAGVFGLGASAKTATITIYNETETNATVSFDWTATSVNELKIDGSAYTGPSGSFSKVLAAKASVVVTITTAKNATENKLVMSNFAVVAAKTESDITFRYDSALGSVTAGGAPVADGGVISVPMSGAVLKAAPASGTVFVGWVNVADSKILSKDAEFTLTPADDMTVKACFAAGTPWFLVNSGYLYEGLDAAAEAAASAANKTVVLMNNATLPAGNYTIPAGVTLLIPFDDSNTLCTTEPVYKNGLTATPTAYRTLTMAAGANIFVNGAISLSGQQVAGNPLTGAPKGPVSFIRMESGSTITVNSGAKLYVWGYITGSGCVDVKSGGTVYEDFQVANWRGGTATSNMLNNTQGVFPMSQYYIQNVEVPMTLEAGAVENGYMSVYVSSMLSGSAVPFVGPNGMFNIVSGSITKDYDETRDRLIVTVDGEIKMQSLSVSMKMGILSKTIDSSKYELPVNSNITVRIANGGKATITQDIALLPGAEMIVEKGGECILGSGNNIYVYDADEWGNYSYTTTKVNPLPYAPGKTGAWHNANTDAVVHIAGVIDASAGHVYVTASGATITGEEGARVLLNPGTQTVTYQAAQSGSDISYVSIPIKAVQLVENDAGPGEYKYENGVWVSTFVHEHSYTEEVTIEAGCETAGLKTFTCGCGESYTEEIPAAGHTEVIDEAVTPTCTATGLTEGRHCSVCEEVLVKQEVVEATGHTQQGNVCTVCGAQLDCQHAYEAVVTAPTCTEEGYTTYTCQYCGDTYTGEEKVEALGHAEVVDEAVAPTCTETGLTEGKHCSVCEEVLVKQEVVEATGHTQQGNVCTVCGAPLDCQHAYEAVVTAPTCTEEGYTTYTCQYCQDTYVGEEKTAATGHTEVIDEAVAPSCTETGLAEGKHCSVCEEVLVEQEVVEAAGHTEAIDEAVAPSCTETGLAEGKHCSVCEEVLVEQEVVEATGHKLVQIPAKAPTYTEQGWDAYETCENCEYSTFTEFIPVIVGEAKIETYDAFVENLGLLEYLAADYAKQHPGKDPIALVIKYIRTGVDRYNSGSWGIMAGYEDAGFAKYVKDVERQYNAEVTDGAYVEVTGMKNIENFYLPNGNYVDFGHMFGAMDITYHNRGSVNHADVSGWAGDLVDLLSTSDRHGVSGSLEDMVKDISENYLCHTFEGESDLFSLEDMYGDLDAYYVMEALYSAEYEAGTLAGILTEYCTENLSDEIRADYFLRNRLGSVSTRTQIRDAVYNAYTSNKVIATLESTREFSSTANLPELRKAVCYAFADYLCRLAGDFVDVTDNPYFAVFSSESSTLAPGITQEIKYATSADNKQMVYYIATADITRDDVHVYANYNNNDPAAGWAMSRVLDQANAAQQKRGNPESESYIPNYNVIAATNGAGYNMSNGEPGGLLVMGGVEYHTINSNGFFGILKDGTPVIGTTEEYNTIYKNQVQEGIAAFGSTLVKDGKISISRTESYYTSRASRTAVGITGTGKVVLMVLDGRQEPWSCGGSMEEIAQIMLEAGCVEAVNLDGGGSTTYVAKQEGDDELSVVNRPSDGAARSVATTLMIVSTAPSSTAFDHAKLESDFDYATVNTPVEITPVGISATGNIAELPEDYAWAVSDERWGTITDGGIFTGLRNGSVQVYLMHGEEIIGTKTMNIVTPDTVYFTKATVDAVYGSAIDLPIAALYEGKKVAISVSDIDLSMSTAAAGTINGFVFTGNEASGVKVVKITASLVSDSAINGAITVNLYKQGENTFDFDRATGGDRQFAWYRVVSNSTTDDGFTYTVVDTEEPLITSYTFAIDMSEIPIPEKLADLVYMLPGADMSGASAWTFLLQLAERVSTLTEVTPVLHFDERFDVDYSELKIINEYFELTSTEFDETANTLTLKLNWINQTAAIDPMEANPLCLVSGIKLVPKGDAAWTNNKLNVLHNGEISYNIYLRANALYSFAQKAENQKVYGLKPFVNPNLPSESGAYFGDVYKTYEDTYVVVNAKKSGWVIENGGYAYYVDGEKLTGIHEIEGYYYDFGSSGINIGQTKYTGLIVNEEKTEYRYAKFGKLMTGWQQVKGEYYYFSPSNYCAVDGEQKIADGYTADTYTYMFENYVLVKGHLVDTPDGIRYRWAGAWRLNSWVEDESKKYFVNAYGYVETGMFTISNTMITYMADENGAWLEDYVGPYAYDGKIYFCDHGIRIFNPGLVYVDGYYYYFSSAGYAVTNGRYWVTKDENDYGYTGWQDFDEEGRMILSDEDPDAEVKNGIITEADGTLAYYINGVKQYSSGLVSVDGDLYYVSSSGKVCTGRVWVSNDNGLGYQGWQEFGEDGKMAVEKPEPEPDPVPEVKNGVVTEADGTLAYYINGVKQYSSGLINVDGDLYYVSSSGKVCTGRVWVSNDNGLGYQGWQEFGEDGKMAVEKPEPEPDPVPEVKNGVVTEADGTLAYYINGVKQYSKGLINVDGDLYYVSSSGKVCTGSVWVSNDNGLGYQGWQEFGEDGKMAVEKPEPEPDPVPEVKNGVVTEADGTLAYYINGVKQHCKGLIDVDGDLYYVSSSGKVCTGRVWVTNDNGFGYQGWQEFSEDGKMIIS